MKTAALAIQSVVMVMMVASNRYGTFPLQSKYNRICMYVCMYNVCICFNQSIGNLKVKCIIENSLYLFCTF